MDVMQAIRARRSMRRFTREPVGQAVLADIAEAARLSPTGVNRQPLQFAIVADATVCGRIFPFTAWAGKIPDGSAGPTEETQPSAYVMILVDKRIAAGADNDAGAAAMSVQLAAQAHGVASCWLGSLQRKEILAVLGLDAERFALHTAVALGYPAMASRAVAMDGESTDYYLEAPGKLCVPKRAEEDVVRWYVG